MIQHSISHYTICSFSTIFSIVLQLLSGIHCNHYCTFSRSNYSLKCHHHYYCLESIRDDMRSTTFVTFLLFHFVFKLLNQIEPKKKKNENVFLVFYVVLFLPHQCGSLKRSLNANMCRIVYQIKLHISTKCWHNLKILTQCQLLKVIK